ncbi:MAG: hypothetical protein HQL87_14900 [Magnetococcales bacterium]|nr:hypothetical protein [Magnetococcales bacterium]
MMGWVFGLCGWCNKALRILEAFAGGGGEPPPQTPPPFFFNHFEDGRGVTFAEGTLGGLRLMERMVGHDRAVLIDACITGQHQPGTIVCQDWEEMPGSRYTWSSHDTTLPVALALGRSIGLTLPSVIRIWGVEVKEVDTFGEHSMFKFFPA